jgi:predicted MFS family arabinose efflux permease
LPYIRAVERLSYLEGALHQLAYAIGGGLAGLLAARERPSIGPRATIAGGLLGGGLAGLAVAYGRVLALTLAGAFLMSLLGTAALIRVWAALADQHGPRRAVAMTEGEVAVSFAGIMTPLLISGLALTALTWRFGFVIGAGLGVLAAFAVTRVPARREPRSPSPRQADDGRLGRGRLPPTLVIVFAIVALEFSLSFWLASYLNTEIGLGRDAAVALVSVLYGANLVGRLVASRLTRRAGAAQILAGALITALLGVSVLLISRSAGPAMLGVVIAGMGIAVTFPLASSLHVQASARTANSALGQTLAIAAGGQIAGPLTAGAIAQASDLRVGLLVLPVLIAIAAIALSCHRVSAARS